MSAAVALPSGAMPIVSKRTEMFWELFQKQITSFNTVIAIPGWIYDSFNSAALEWIAAQYLVICNNPVMFVRDSIIDQVFLGPQWAFPPSALLNMPAPGIPILKDPTQLKGFAGPSDTLISNSSVSPSPAPTDSVISGAASTVSKKDKVPRPPNAFILYRKDHHPHVKAANPGIHNNDISVILGSQWQNETDDVRHAYKSLAERLKREHSEKYPEYQYRPRKSSEKKRRMTKKKAAELAAMIPTAASFPSDDANHESNPVDAFDENIAQRLFGTEPKFDANRHDFTGLTGSWSTERQGILPANKAVFNALRRHNYQQNGQPGAIPDKPTDFGPSQRYDAQHWKDYDSVDWQSVEAEIAFWSPLENPDLDAFIWANAQDAPSFETCWAEL